MREDAQILIRYHWFRYLRFKNRVGVKTRHLAHRRIRRLFLKVMREKKVNTVRKHFYETFRLMALDDF